MRNCVENVIVVKVWEKEVTIERERVENVRKMLLLEIYLPLLLLRCSEWNHRDSIFDVTTLWFMPRSLWSSRTNLYLPTHLPIMHKFLFPTKKWFVSVPLFPLSSFSSSSVWPDLAIFCHFWQQVKKNWQLFEDLISIWQNFEPTMEIQGAFGPILLL